jgi:hypothetical protein
MMVLFILLLWYFAGFAAKEISIIVRIGVLHRTAMP